MSAEERINPTKIQELAYEFKVLEAMTRNVITIGPDEPMERLREILQGKRISGLPVVERGRMIGMVSIDNFINCIMSGDINQKVRDNMIEEIEVLHDNEPLIHAISKFDKLGYGRFPVVEYSSNKLIGIITKGDIIECLLKKLEINYHEEEIQRYRASHIFEDLSSDNTTVILKFKIPGGNFKVAGQQSGYLKVNLLRLGVPPQVTRRAIVACCEAEMNIIIFTGGGEITAQVNSKKIKITAEDKGPGIADIEKAMIPGYSTASDWVREMGFGAGMGLPNIKNCSDDMNIVSVPSKGTKLEFEVNLESDK